MADFLDPFGQAFSHLSDQKRQQAVVNRYLTEHETDLDRHLQQALADLVQNCGLAQARWPATFNVIVMPASAPVPKSCKAGLDTGQSGERF